MTQLIVFDCDGTLVDSQAVIVACAQDAFAAVGLVAPSVERIRHIVGVSLEPAMRMLLGRDDPEMGRRIAEAYREAFFARRAMPDHDEPLFEGVLETLDALAARGAVMGVATGKTMRGLVQILERHALERYFVTLQTADLHPSKPHPSMLEAAMRETGAAADATWIIGDTTWDIEMGRLAGCRSIGVSYGNHAPEVLRTAGAAHVIDRLNDLLDLV
ncbi:MAG: HAD-IA family hydrolase [Geminicoccaceae bacterium]|jgi:phosphoglycolate phosphatase|nr:HAD-IA family hydrolase [Geminicoccaceae bacterium]MCB9968843.1 HAD-IA family hydrolase [Geminicoccaceae bacterium]HRY24551.1 HAD-IA family hydrolase [Geminicoccaceae bacterium]